MTKTQKVWYELQFNVTYGDEIIEMITKRTAKAVKEMIEESRKQNKQNLLHKMGFEQKDYDRWEETLNRMEKALEAKIA